MIVKPAVAPAQRAGLPPVRLLNMVVERTPQGVDETVRLQRPGLRERFDLGSGPIRGIFHAAGAVLGAVFSVSGSAVYRNNLTDAAWNVGTNRRPVRFAASASQLVIVSNGKAFVWEASVLTQITDEDLPLVSDVFNLGARFYFLEEDSDRWWFSAVDDPFTIDGLAFATAESAPDASVGAQVLGDEAWFFGVETVEVWYQTGDADAPLQRSQGRRFDKGCVSRDSLVKLDNSIFWATTDHTVCRADNVPDVISEPWIEEKLEACDDLSECTAYVTAWPGHLFYVLNIPGQGTFAYDVTTKTWSEFATKDRDNFRVSCGVVTSIETGGNAWMGDAEDGHIWAWEASQYKDKLEPMQRAVSFAARVESGRIPCVRFELQCKVGVGNEDCAAPLVEMRYSNDLGQTWSTPRSRSLGAKGQYAPHHRPKWLKLGLMRSPGRMFEVMCADEVQFMVHNAFVNG